MTNSNVFPVASGTEVARWVQVRSRSSSTPIAAVEVDGLPISVFLDGQLLIDGSDLDLVAHLVEHHGGRVVPRPPVPSPPTGLGPKEGLRLNDMPLPTLVQLTTPREPSPHAAELLRAHYGLKASVTSEASARFLGVASELAASGRHVGLNTLSRQSALPLAAPVEASQARDISVNAFSGRASVLNQTEDSQRG